MKVLLTGGTGFIGKRLLAKLVEKGYEVKVLVRSKESEQKISHFPVQIVQGDITEPDSLFQAVQGVDIIYHLAAYAHPSLIQPYSLYEKINVQGTKNILEAACQSKVKKVLIMSSIAATGPSSDGSPLHEKSNRKPITNYGKSKAAIEDMALSYFQEKNLPVVIIRPPFVYGIGDKDWVGFFIMIKTGGVPLLGLPFAGDHKNLLDFCYVDNLVQGLVQAAESEKTSGEIYFLSDNHPYTIQEIILAVAQALGIPYPKKFWPKWFAFFLAGILQTLGKVFHFEPPLAIKDVKWMTSNYWICTSSKARKDFGYKPEIELQEGIKRTIDWAIANNIMKKEI